MQLSTTPIVVAKEVVLIIMVPVVRHAIQPIIKLPCALHATVITILVAAIDASFEAICK
jgi:hypothetical protein